jgi:hypothetical protein
MLRSRASATVRHGESETSCVPFVSLTPRTARAAPTAAPAEPRLPRRRALHRSTGPRLWAPHRSGCTRLGGSRARDRTAGKVSSRRRPCRGAVADKSNGVRFAARRRVRLASSLQAAPITGRDRALDLRPLAAAVRRDRGRAGRGVARLSPSRAGRHQATDPHPGPSVLQFDRDLLGVRVAELIGRHGLDLGLGLAGPVELLLKLVPHR